VEPLPLVSVVIPTHNRAHLVAGAVESALAQSHPNVEVVLVDDGSHDETPRVAAELAERYDRLRSIRLDEGGSAARARNAGVREARGSVIGFLDDDCRWLPTKLEGQLRVLDADHGVVACQQRIREVGGDWVVEARPPGGRPHPESLLGIGTNTLLVRRALFDSVGGFDEALPRLQEWELLIRLTRSTKLAFVPEVLVEGVMVEGGITLTRGPLLDAARRIASRHAHRLPAKDRALLHYILGKFLLVEGYTREARSFMRAGLRTDPLPPRYWAGLMATFLGPGPARWIRDRRRRSAP
jgi:glycosyltransferase involved in cell wall biosynthesis